MEKITKHHSLQPIHVFLFMLSCMVALAILCEVMPQQIMIGGYAVRIPQLSQVLDIHSGVDTTATLDTMAIDSATVMPIVDWTDTVDTHKYLSTFYKALQGADTAAIRIVHYGDSQIEEDRLSIQVRRAAQKRYGGGGVGLLPLHQTIPTRTIHQLLTMNGEIQSANQGPKRYIVYGLSSMRRDNACYGVMGQVAVMDNELVAGSENLTLHVEETKMTRGSESYFNRIRVLTEGDIHITVDSALSCTDGLFAMPDSSTHATIHLMGKGDVFGVSLENERGIMVDNIPMRGCSGAVFSGMVSKNLQDYFTATNTKLIILQYGGNTIPHTTTPQQVEQYVSSMRAQVQYLKILASGSSLLFVGPSDMSERYDGELHTNQMVPLLDKALRKMAVQEHIGYFSLYDSMGGYDSMIRWHEEGWAGNDYIHFTRSGSDKAGKMLAEWIF